jgi:hypothetical protein
MNRLFTLSLLVLLPTIIQPVLSLPVPGPSLFPRALPAHPITAKDFPGHAPVQGKNTYTSIVHHDKAQTPAQVEQHAQTAYAQAHAHAVANGHNPRDPFIMAALHVPPDANHDKHTTYLASIPKGAGNAHYKAHPEEVHPGAGDNTFMHAETHALALAHADGRRPGPGSYMAVHGNHANGGADALSPCSTGGKNCESALRAHQIGFGGQSTHRSGAPSPEAHSPERH